MTRDLFLLLLVVFNLHKIQGRSLEPSETWGHGDKTEVGTEWNDPSCEPGDYSCVNEPDSSTARVHYPQPCHGAPSEVPGVDCIVGPGLASRRPDIPRRCHGAPGEVPGVNCLVGPGLASRRPDIPRRCHGAPGEVPGVNCLVGPGLASRRPDIPQRCHGAPGEVPGVNCIIGPGLVSRTTAQDDPDCRPRPGQLPPIKCQDPSSLTASYVTQTSSPADTKAVSSGSAVAKVFETCKYTWQLPGTDCWPPIGQSPHCDHPHNSGCATTPPRPTTGH